ncbi:MAG: hypothetical protein Q8O61_04085 [Nocardioides sp.]|nr:hypothetical protein [Nocardioides sp.]
MDAVLLAEVVAVVAVLVALWVAPDWDALRARARRVGRRLHLVAPVASAPPGPPIERIAADVRRIRTDIRHAPPGMPVARLRGWCAAYDDVLVMACRSLDLEQSLETRLTMVERELERERVERMLVRAGLLVEVA